MNRQQALDAAAQCVLTDRNAAYGNPEQNFANTATIWTVYLRTRGLIAPDAALEPYDVANLMIGLKLARLGASPTRLDNYVDVCGYGACGAECVPDGSEGAE